VLEAGPDLREKVDRQAPLEVPIFKDLFGLTREAGHPLLEYLDRRAYPAGGQSRLLCLVWNAACGIRTSDFGQRPGFRCAVEIGMAACGGIALRFSIEDPYPLRDPKFHARPPQSGFRHRARSRADFPLRLAIDPVPPVG